MEDRADGEVPMSGVKVRGRMWSGRAFFTAFGATALVLVLAAVAWACTQRVGTLLVCQPAAKRFVSADRCGRVTGTTQTGSPSFSSAGGEIFSVKATNFQATAYNVTFLRPGSTASCHRASTDTVVLSSTAGKTQFLGPKFYAEFDTTQLSDQGLLATNGVAKICSQDMPDVIVGQVISLAVV